jgi:hypothetical protein
MSSSLPRPLAPMATIAEGLHVGIIVLGLSMQWRLVVISNSFEITGC